MSLLKKLKHFLCSSDKVRIYEDFKLFCVKLNTNKLLTNFLRFLILVAYY